MTKTLVHVRWWIDRDSPQVLGINLRNYGDASMSEKYFLSLLSTRGIVCCVASKGDNIMGYVIYELFAHRIDILHFEVDPAWQRCGIGTQLFSNLVAKLSESDKRSITMKVPESNLRSQLFLKKMGAKVIKIIRKYDESSGENYFLFSYSPEYATIDANIDCSGVYVDK